MHTACTHHVACTDMRYAAQAQAGYTLDTHARSSARAHSAPRRAFSHFAGLFGRSSVECERHTHSLPEVEHSECTVLAVLTQ